MRLKRYVRSVELGDFTVVSHVSDEILQLRAYRVNVATHFNVHSGGDPACGVGGVVREKSDLAGRPDGPIAERERQREEQSDDEDDDDNIAYSYDAAQLLRSCSVTHQDVPLSGHHQTPERTAQQPAPR